MTGEELPKARIRRRRLFRLVWVVPVVAVAVAAWLVFQHLRTIGPEITITFSDGAGLRVGQTPVKYRGVAIGEVSRVELAPDHKQVLVHVRLVRSAEPIARDGAIFWIVRPQVGWGNVTGLNTVLSGPEIQVLPGRTDAESKREFKGLESPPVGLETAGLKIILRAERPMSLRANSPVYYRGVEVGVVQQIDLSPNAASADVHILVFQRYAPLVRGGSAFWNVSGLNLKGSILKGIEVDFESFRALITGGIEFATPPGTARAKPGTVFFLHEQPKKEWLGWAPPIKIAPAER
ncbi:MAG: paraquat-inducible protein [Betaproteobacteria bacterium]|jgi:paraquat-inducible protein B|nr:paraquat-inducible protein [Betaproteobacteria bacterium]